MSNLYGLSEKQVLLSRKQNGSNTLRKIKRKPLIKRYLENFNDPIIHILLIALFLNLVFSLGSFNPAETIGIAAAVLISTLVSTVSEYGSEKAFDRMMLSENEGLVRVVREGSLREIARSEIVVGDYVLIGAGEKCAADGFLISGRLEVDQSALTGESALIEKYPCENRSLSPDNSSAMLCGSVVSSGSGVVCIEKVGENTVYGSTAGEICRETRESPLKVRLNDLAKKISKIGYIAAAVVALVVFFSETVLRSGFDRNLLIQSFSDLPFISHAIIKSLTMAITIVVVAVPEGLPMMITVVLSSNMKRMLKDHILVKKLVGIETAGSLNILFCDKTGTLTSGKQRVESFIRGDLLELSPTKIGKTDPEIAVHLAYSAVYNTEATIIQGKAKGGNPLDIAVTDAFSKYLPQKAAVCTEKIVFSSERKYAAAAVRSCAVNVYYKGAPEILLPFCRSCLVNGKKCDFSIEKYRQRIFELEKEGKRLCVIAISDQMPTNSSLPEMCLLGLCVINDALRPGVRTAASEIIGAGVQIVMITGDAPGTAISVAKSCGIFPDNKDPLVLTSAELSDLSDDEISELLPRICVIARALPGDKSRLVRIAQKKGLVVGMTGDGINDVPALRLADVGFAMGSGTDIAKEAGDVVILNNDLNSIGKCMLFGRTIFKSIRKFILFQLSMNLCAVAVTLIGPFIGVDTPITVIQMLWINIIMDTLGGLAFAGEAPRSESMREKPKQRQESLINRYMVSQIILSGLFTVLLCLFFLVSEKTKRFYLFDTNRECFYSAFFCLFIFLGVFNCFTARTASLNLFDSLGRNKNFIVIMLLVTVIQLTMVYFGGSVFRGYPLSFARLVWVMIAAFMIVPADFCRKVVVKTLGVKSGL